MTTTVDLYSPHVLDRLDPFQQCVIGFLARCKNPKTLRSYHEDLRNYLAWCDRQQPPLAPLLVKRVHLDMYVRWMEAQHRWAESTISRRLGTVRQLYKYAAMEDFVAKDPSIGVATPTVDRAKQRRTYLNPVQFAQLLAAAQKGSADDHALVALLGMMGLRIGEACSLDIENLTYRDGYQVLSFIGKGSKAARVPVPIPVMRALAEVIDGRTSGPILRNQRGERMNQPAATRILKRLARAAGVPDYISPHSLRRTFATTGLLMRVPLYEVQVALWHESSRTTSLYDMGKSSLDRNAVHQIAGIQASLAAEPDEPQGGR